MWESPVSTPTRTLHIPTRAEASASVVRPTKFATGVAGGPGATLAPASIRSAAARSAGAAQQDHAQPRARREESDQARPPVLEPVLVRASGERTSRDERYGRRLRVRRCLRVLRCESALRQQPERGRFLLRAAGDLQRERLRGKVQDRGQVGVLGGDLARISPALHQVGHEEAGAFPGAEADPHRRTRQERQEAAAKEPLGVDDGVEAAVAEGVAEVGRGPDQGVQAPPPQHLPPRRPLPDDHLVQVRVVADDVGGTFLGCPGDARSGEAPAKGLG